MAAIWKHDGSVWSLLSAKGFADENALHTLVGESPQLLPLAGSPQLVIAGREVRLGSGYADLIAVETEGRLAIIEIKLAKNAEARRAVVSQVLAYAAYLRGLSVDEINDVVLREHLRQRGCSTLAELVTANDQSGSTTEAKFNDNLAKSLADGRFRLVIVLDSAPDELVDVAGYLQAISDKILLDLITVSAYQVGDSQIIVPQRVDPEHSEPEVGVRTSTRLSSGQLSEGSAEFEASILKAKESERPRLRMLLDWANSLERDGLARLFSYHGTLERWVLLPKLQPDDVGLVTIWNDSGAAIQYWRTVFARKAPSLIDAVEAKLGTAIRQGNTSRLLDQDLLALLTAAYRAANT